MKILIIDDHELFSYSLKLVLENKNENYHVLIQSDTSKVETILSSLEIDIILLDINLQNESGLSVGKKIKLLYPTIPLVFLTGFDLPEYRLKAKKMNADGFLNKTINAEELIYSIEKIVGSEMTGFESEKSKLSEQEKKILILLSQGYTQQHIALELKVSRRTVNNQVQSIHEKLNVNTCFWQVGNVRNGS